MLRCTLCAVPAVFGAGSDHATFRAVLCYAFAGSVAELCKDPAAEAWMLAELNTVGKENKVSRTEQGTFQSSCLSMAANVAHLPGQDLHVGGLSAYVFTHCASVCAAYGIP